MNPLRQFVFGAVLAIVAAAVLWGWWSHHQLASARAAATAATARADGLAAQLAAAKQDTRIVTQYVDRVHTVEVRGRDIIQKVPVYVPQTVDAACTVNRGFVRVYNAAAQGVDLPGTAGALDATGSGVALSTVASTSVDNFTTYHAVAARLTALQEWARTHSAPIAATSTGPP